VSEPVSPASISARLRDIERETGLILFGKLSVDLPKNAKSKWRHQPIIKGMIQGMIQYLVEEACSGRMRGNVVFGWRDGRRPDNADAFVNSIEAMMKWVESRLAINVFVKADFERGGVVVRVYCGDALEDEVHLVDEFRLDRPVADESDVEMMDDHAKRGLNDDEGPTR